METEDEKTAELVRAGLLGQGLIETPHTEADETTVSIPVEGMSAEGLKNLVFLTRSKQYLINRAFAEDVFRVPTALVEELGSTEIPDAETFLQTFQNHAEGCRGISFQDGKITFTLPTAGDPGMIKAFTHLTAAMVRQAKEQSHSNRTDKIALCSAIISAVMISVLFTPLLPICQLIRYTLFTVILTEKSNNSCKSVLPVPVVFGLPALNRGHRKAIYRSGYLGIERQTPAA